MVTINLTAQPFQEPVMKEQLQLAERLLWAAAEQGSQVIGMERTPLVNAFKNRLVAFGDAKWRDGGHAFETRNADRSHVSILPRRQIRTLSGCCLARYATPKPPSYMLLVDRCFVSASLITGHNSIPIASVMRSSVFKVGHRNSRSIRLIMVCDKPARLATSFIERPIRSRFRRSRRTTDEPTISSWSVATPQTHSKKELTGYVPIGTCEVCLFDDLAGTRTRTGHKSPALWKCPDVWELDGGDFAVIGIDITTSSYP